MAFCVLQCTEDVTQLPSLLTNTVLQLRQGLKVLCKDHGKLGLEKS